MTDAIQVVIHASQFPERLLADLRDSLRARQLHHKLLYETPRQAQKWIALHQAYSPAQQDHPCQGTYDACFEALTRQLPGGERVNVIGLGCGSGEKDARLLTAMLRAGQPWSYTPVDGSHAMVVTASLAAERCLLLDVPAARDSRLGAGCICDLGTVRDFDGVIGRMADAAQPRVIAFFGTLHNFEPPTILPRLAQLTRPGDFLLVGTNLAPGEDYAAGVRGIVGQYNNAMTNDWLSSALTDVGVEPSDGTIVWRVEVCPAGSDCMRVAAYFRFARPRILTAGGEKFDFRSGDTLRLFYSYRFTAERLGPMFRSAGLEMSGQWLAPSGEEGLFVVRRSS